MLSTTMWPALAVYIVVQYWAMANFDLQDSTREWSASVQATSKRRQQERQELEEQNTEEYRRKLSADELANWDERLKQLDKQDT